MLNDMRGTITVITVIIVTTTNRTVRRGGAFSAIITVTRSVVIIRDRMAEWLRPASSVG